MTTPVTRIANTTLLLSLLLLAAGFADAQVRPSIAGLQAQIATLQAQVDSGTIPGVSGYATLDTSVPSRPTLRIAGANLQVVNGLGGTATANGVGNVIVGYDETSSSSNLTCSLGEHWNSQPACLSAGGTWAISHKTGSHNVVVGALNSYSRYGGVVAGLNNRATGGYSSAIGGFTNLAAGFESTVTGGSVNVASGSASSVTGGSGNTATGTSSAVSGGASRSATGGNDWRAGSLLEDN